MTYTLHPGDCLDVLRLLPDASIDMVLCDLPYGTTRNTWDSVIPLEPLWAQYRRICKPSAAIVLTAQTPFDKVLGCSNLAWLRHEWVWVKGMATGHLNASYAPLKAHETVCVFYGARATYHPQMESGAPYVDRRPNGRKPTSNYGGHARPTLIVNTGERYPRSVLHFADDRPRSHPTQKPVALMAYLIRTYSNPGDTVLDNAMGSGTTGVAALQEGRSFIGIEKEPVYYRIAQQRIGGVLQAVS